MNFFCDSGGNIFHVDPEKVYQGSANANTIYFIGAFASNLSVTIAYRLPNGLWTTPILMTAVTDSSLADIQDAQGQGYSVWTVKITGAITGLYGTVDVQFFVYGNNGTAKGALIATALSSFEVSKGVPITLPSTPTDNYEQLLTDILTALSTANGDISQIKTEQATQNTAIGVIQGDISQIKTEQTTQNTAIDVAELRIDILQEQNSDQSLLIKQNTAKIENLTNILLETEQVAIVEVSQAFTTRQTADGENIIDEQNVFPKSIKGSTVRCENLFCVEDYSKTVNGVTVTVKDNKLTMVGTATTGGGGWIHLKQAIPAGTYSSIIGREQMTQGMGVNLFLSEAVALTNQVAFAHADYPITAITTSFISNYIRYYCKEGMVLNFSVDLMLNAGETALPYQPYFTGLKNAYLQSIKSTGRNLFCVEDYSETVNGVTITVKDNKLTMVGTTEAATEGWIPLKQAIPAGTYSSIFGVEHITQGLNTHLFLSKAVGDYTDRTPFVHGSYPVTSIKTTFISNYIMYYCKEGMVLNLSVDLMLNHGATALPYEPYTEDTYQLPQTLELGQWDSFDPQTGELTRQTETITLDGSKAWITTRGDGIISGWYSKPEHWTAFLSYTDNNFVSSKRINGITSARNFHNLFPIGTTLEEVQAYFDGIVIAGELKVPTVEKLENTPKFYKAWNNGSETVVQGDTDNSADGAMCTLTNDYFVKVGGATNE